MRMALMIIGWWAGGIVLCSVVLPYRVNGVCPKLSIKCWIGSLCAVAFGLGYYFLMGMKDGFASLDYLVSFVCAAAVSAAVGRVTCPL